MTQLPDHTEIEAAAFRRLLQHLNDHKEVQNIDLMILADFCRNCLSKWYAAAAEERNIPFLGTNNRIKFEVLALFIFIPLKLGQSHRQTHYYELTRDCGLGAPRERPHRFTSC